MESFTMKGTQMQYTSYSTPELVRLVDNKPDATPLERELANRIDELLVEIKMLQPVIHAQRNVA